MKCTFRQRGVVMVEYAIALFILVPIFLVIGIALRESIASRGQASRSTVRHTTPESDALSALRSGGDGTFDNTYQDEH